MRPMAAAARARVRLRGGPKAELASPQPASNGVIRVLCTDLELSDGLLPTHLPDKHQALKLLVRLHGEPLGYLELPPGPIRDEQLLPLLEAEVGRRVQEHLAEDVQSSPSTVRDAIGAPHCGRDDQDTTSVTVVLCTRDRAQLVRGCLQNLAKLEHKSLDFVVVDNAPSSDDTQKVFDETVGDDDRFRYVREPLPGLSRARNTGLAHATGDVVAFTDDDVTVDSMWILGLLRGFRRGEEIGCVTGMVATASIEGPAEAFFDSRVTWASSCTPRVYRRKDPTAGPLHPWAAGQFGTGANFAFRTKVLRELGGFDECLGAGSYTKGGEDLDIFVRALLADEAIAYEPFALVWHTHRTDVSQLEDQMFAYGMGLGAYLTKHLLVKESAADMLVRLPIAVRHMRGVLNRPWQQDDNGTDDMRFLRRAELQGLARGPLAYLKARRHEAAVRSDNPGRSLTSR